MADTVQPFATVADLTKFWKAPEVAGRAEYLLELASNRLRLIAENSSINLDEKSEASAPYKSVLQGVVLEAVKRALQAPTDQQPMETYGQTAGPYSENIKYTNPTGDLWFKKTELSGLGLNGNQRLDSVSSTKADIYGS